MWKITKKQEGMLSRFQGTFDIPFSKRWVEVMAHWKKSALLFRKKQGSQVSWNYMVVWCHSDSIAL